MSKSKESQPPIEVEDRTRRYTTSGDSSDNKLGKIALAIGDAISDRYGKKLSDTQVQEIRRIFFDDQIDQAETEKLFLERFPDFPGLYGVLVLYLPRAIGGNKGANN